MIITKYRWFRIESDGDLSSPIGAYDANEEMYKYIDVAYDSELDALNALEEYHSHQICASDEFTLVKTYHVACKF